MLSASVCVCGRSGGRECVCVCVCERQALRNLHMLRQMNWLVNEMKPNCKMTASSTINSHLVMRTHTHTRTHKHTHTQREVPAHTLVGRSKSYCEWLSRYAGSMSMSKDALTCLTCPRWPQAQCGTRRRTMRLRIRELLRRPLRGQLRMGIQYY